MINSKIYIFNQNIKEIILNNFVNISLAIGLISLIFTFIFGSSYGKFLFEEDLQKKKRKKLKKNDK